MHNKIDLTDPNSNYIIRRADICKEVTLMIP